MPSRPIAAILMLCAWTAAFGAPLAAADEDPPSMRFEWVREGPPDVCASQCREWVSAVGPITAETARDFEFFSEVRDIKGATLVLDSGGGSVLASLDLGRKMRELGVITTVGRTMKIPTAPGQVQRAKLSPRGECASMCVFVLLGGAKRQVPTEARILVHQIWPGGKRYDASAETYSADELVRIQRDVGRIARYTIEMGGDIELFELAMRIPPWERLRTLTAAELRRMRLQTLETVAEVATSGVAAAVKANAAPAALLPERGWMVAEKSRLRALLRSHPLTIEGDEVGRFELSLSCSETPGTYRIGYQETRGRGGVATPSDRVKDVNLWVAGERATLDVSSSEPRAGEADLQSTASGQLTAGQVEKMRKDPTATVLVATRTVENARTSIRLGATGFAQSFPKLAAECQKQLHASAERIR